MKKFFLYLTGMIALGLCLNVSAMRKLDVITKKSPLIENSYDYDQETAITLPQIVNNYTPAAKTPVFISKKTMLNTLEVAITRDDDQSTAAVRELMDTLTYFGGMPNFEAAFDVEQEADRNLLFKAIQKKQYDIEALLLNFYLNYQHKIFYEGTFLSHQTISRDGRVNALLQILFKKLLDINEQEFGVHLNSDFVKHLMDRVESQIGNDQAIRKSRVKGLLDILYQRLFAINKDRTQPHIHLVDFADKNLMVFINNRLIRNDQKLINYLNNLNQKLTDFLDYKAEKLKEKSDKEFKEYYASRYK